MKRVEWIPDSSDGAFADLYLAPAPIHAAGCACAVVPVLPSCRQAATHDGAKHSGHLERHRAVTIAP